MIQDLLIKLCHPNPTISPITQHTLRDASVCITQRPQRWGGSDPTTYTYSSIKAYLQEDADVGVPIDYHDYFKELGKTFAERVKRFMYYDEMGVSQKTPLCNDFCLAVIARNEVTKQSCF
ncbi:MAG: hypothetical protein AB1444_04645 [Spirochaetota bacterium]